MNVPQIMLESNFIRVGLKIEKPVQEIEQPPAVQSIQRP